MNQNFSADFKQVMCTRPCLLLVSQTCSPAPLSHHWLIECCCVVLLKHKPQFFLWFLGINQRMTRLYCRLGFLLSFKNLMLWKTTCVSVLDVSIHRASECTVNVWKTYTGGVFITRLFYGLLNKQVVGRLNVFEFSQCLSLAQSSSCMSLNGPETADITDDSFIT